MAVLTAHGGGQIEVVGEAGTMAAAISECARLRPDVVLLDIRLPDGTGLEACRTILQRQPKVQVLVLTSFANDKFVYEAVTSGAHGYIMKEVAPADLVQAILDVAEGKSILDPDLTAGVMRLLRSPSGQASTEELAALSPQERRVLALVAEGKTNKEIGEQLDLSDNTVKNYLRSVYEKLQVRRRSQAAAAYIKSSNPPSG